MDVDLSTALNALLPLVAPLVSGHSDLAIGARPGSGARVVRGPKREFISRSYNLLLKAMLLLSLLLRPMPVRRSPISRACSGPSAFRPAVPLGPGRTTRRTRGSAPARLSESAPARPAGQGTFGTSGRNRTATQRLPRPNA